MEQELNNKEREALIAIYQATGGDDWKDNKRWCSDAPVDKWYGVKSDPEGRIVELNLSNNNLQGSLPSEIAYLEHLTQLRLSDNNLSGQIPPELFSLSQLKYLYLGRNCLTGKIPSEIGALTNLQSLHLEMNELSGELPHTIGQLSQLEFLDLSYNKFGGTIPLEIGSLVELKYLCLERNDFSGVIPLNFRKLKNLTHLNLCLNNLNGELPFETLNKMHLSFLDLSCNRFSGHISSEFLQMTIRYLHLWGNYICWNKEIASLEYKAEGVLSSWDMTTTNFWWRINPQDKEFYNINLVSFGCYDRVSVSLALREIPWQYFKNGIDGKYSIIDIVDSFYDKHGLCGVLPEIPGQYLKNGKDGKWSLKDGKLRLKAGGGFSIGPLDRNADTERIVQKHVTLLEKVPKVTAELYKTKLEAVGAKVFIQPYESDGGNYLTPNDGRGKPPQKKIV